MGVWSSFLYVTAAVAAIYFVVRKVRRVRDDYHHYYRQDVERYTDNH